MYQLLVCLAKNTSKNITRVLDEHKISSGEIPLTDILFLKSQSYFSISYNMAIYLSRNRQTDGIIVLVILNLRLVLFAIRFYCAIYFQSSSFTLYFVFVTFFYFMKIYLLSIYIPTNK